MGVGREMAENGTTGLRCGRRSEGRRMSEERRGKSQAGGDLESDPAQAWTFDEPLEPRRLSVVLLHREMDREGEHTCATLPIFCMLGGQMSRDAHVPTTAVGVESAA